MKLFLFVLFSSFALTSLAQELETEWSEVIPKLEQETPYKVFPTIDSGYAIVKRNNAFKSTISIDFIDSNNVLTYSQKVEVEADKIIHVASINDHITLFSVLHNAEKKEDALSAHTLNSKGEHTGTILIASLKSNGGYLATYKVAVSDDGQKVGVICEKPYMKEKKEELLIKILDKNLQTTLTKEYSYTLDSKKRKFNVPLINNNGSLYIMKRSRIKTTNNYFLTLIKESGVEEHHDLKLRSMRIADVSGDFNADGELIVSGFYAGFNGFNFEGAFSLKYNESTIPEYRKEFMLPETLILALKTKKEISKFGNGLDKFHVKKMIVTDKGSSYLVAEHVIMEKTEKETIETRKGLAIVKFSKKGDFLWAAPIESNQVDDKNKGYWSSSVTFGDDENLYVLYNPIGEGLKKTEDVYGANALVGTKICKIDLNGVVSDNPLVDLYKALPEKVALQAKSYYINNGGVVIVAENEMKNKCYLGTVTLMK